MNNPFKFSDYAGHNKPPVPAQAHTFVRSVVERFRSSNVEAAFSDVVKDKLFGELQIVHPDTAAIMARFEMHSGICKRFNLARVYRGGKRVAVDFENIEWLAVFQQSVFNKDVSFARGGDKQSLSGE
jgi:hypothetical protein